MCSPFSGDQNFSDEVTGKISKNLRIEHYWREGDMMAVNTYKQFFSLLTEKESFDYQEKLGTEPWPDVLEIPTGLGKTAAVCISWLYKCLSRDPETPNRLVYCLPMRVLVEQTFETVSGWLNNCSFLFEEKGIKSPTVNLLMGGETSAEWVEYPEHPAIIIGTQDMLLSRALMRGYGMSRYQWPIHFSLLHNDALWVFDEIQLMGSGLTTSTQCEAFRRAFGTVRPSKSLWISATLNTKWLETVDFSSHFPLHTLRLSEAEEKVPEVKKRIAAEKRFKQSEVRLDKETGAKKAKAYIDCLSKEILEKHIPGTRTLVIVNTVDRAQALFENIRKLTEQKQIPVILIHSRFRPFERASLNQRILESGNDGETIIIATQAVEAGVDITCRTLFTELAPWASLVQRFGRCNRYGEWNEKGGTDVFWIDIDPEAKASAPYSPEELDAVRDRLSRITDVSPQNLPEVDASMKESMVLRKGDLEDLFHTDPDLSGFDVDISPFIRESDNQDVQFFWRKIDNDVQDQGIPVRDELCRVSIAAADKFIKKLVKNKRSVVFAWDSLDGRWMAFSENLRPGMILMLGSEMGGYSPLMGFKVSIGDHVEPVPIPIKTGNDELYGGDWRSLKPKEVRLTDHLAHVRDECGRLCDIFEIPEKEAVKNAGAFHDTGKAHPVFRATLLGCSLDEVPDEGPFLAKGQFHGRHLRKHFRHELASMLAWLSLGKDSPEGDLTAYLIAAHHGKVRMSLRAMPDEEEPTPPFGPRFARGVWEKDRLPEIEIPEFGTIPSFETGLDLMEIGEGSMGKSWTARTRKLLKKYGPFRLAFLETIVRIADWRASEKEQED